MISSRTLQRSREEIHGWWKYYIIEEYSRLSLTFGIDRLPALSGLATKVARRTGDTYLAGLWKEDLCLALLWSPENARENPPTRKFEWEQDLTKPAQIASEYRAPSWSWASIDGEVSHSNRETRSSLSNLQEHMVLLEADCSLASGDPTGKIDFGYLKVSCPTLTATINLKYDMFGKAQYRLSFEDNTVSLEHGHHFYVFQPDVPLAEVDHVNQEGKIEKTVQRSDAENPTQQMVNNVTVKLAFIITVPSEEDNRFGRYCLALGPSSIVEGAWERVGRWVYFNHDWKSDYFPSTVVEDLVIV
jgi:hypothetical protein